MKRIAVFLCLTAAAFAQPRLEVTSRLGTKFYSLPDDKGEVAAAEKALAADPKNLDLLRKLAQAQVNVWQDREAVATLTRALEAAPRDSGLLTERGHREVPLREFARAAADLNRAVTIDPKQMAAWYHLGLAHYFQAEFAPAATAFRQAVETAPNADERINSTNWLYAALRRAGEKDEAARSLVPITPEMKNEAAHTEHYLNLVRLFQGRKTADEILPPEPPAGNTDDEAELRFDTVAYGIGNWHLYNGEPAKAQEYFQRVLKGHIWITWGFVGSEVEVARAAAGKSR
ncbi:MAG TPA: tetratricopeptide repeat protein [Bryobacteraceae bacterium]|nr:tetratricopeptide repeat protein [Bryobacteraceae bacterium]